jgi:hypothetical protein
MKNSYFLSGVKTLKSAIVAVLLFVFGSGVLLAQSPYTFHSGSYIINMGVVPQTKANGLKPYGLIYDLIRNHNIPVYWIIDPAKAKDGKDFTYNGVDYKGGTFIIAEDYITLAIKNKITSYGVTGAYTNSNLTLTPAYRLTSVPKWTLDAQNGGISEGFLLNAGITNTIFPGAFDLQTPALLGVCNDIFVMPHADPKWATHGNLLNWNEQYKGSIWLGCHAGSALENMYNPADVTQQTNFLSNKVTTAGTGIILPVPGSTNYAQNSLVLWGAHAGATIPYNTLTGSVSSGTLATASDPVAQYMGVTDLAHLNGSEQVYLPVKGGGWRTSTQIITYDPSQSNVPAISDGPAVIIAYGRGFGEDDRGYVMLEAGHSINKGSAGDVAAQRAFFNWSFLSTVLKVPVINSITGLPPGNIFNAQPYPNNYNLSVSFSSPVSSGFNSVTWSLTRVDNGASAGTFSPNGTLASANTVFTPNNLTTDVACNLAVKIVDVCGRTTFETYPVTLKACNVTATGVATSPDCFGENGSVLVTVNGSNGTINYTYSGAASGSGSSATSPFTVTNLAAGSYDFTVTDASGCSASFSSLITAPSQLSATTSVTNVLCYGGTGSIDLTVTGGTAPYSYDWADVAGTSNTEDRANVTADTYTVTVTDSKGCATSPDITSVTVTQPLAALTVPGSVTNVTCFGGTNGEINITAAGGTTGYIYDWADIAGTNDIEDRTALAAGNYSVTVTDANGCATIQNFTVTQPAAINLSTVVNQPTCPPNSVLLSSDGEINLSVSGGSGSFTYLWTTGDGVIPSGQEDDQDLTGLKAGTYTVKVTESSDASCFKTLSVTLNYLNPNPVQPGAINN